MKFIIFFAFAFLFFTTSAKKTLSKYDVEQFLIGVLEGIVEDIPDIGPCIEDSGFDIEDVI